MSDRPRRSMLYMPGANPRALEKARGLPADALIFDLEDAVAPEAKARARETVAAALADGDYGRREKLVRINGLDTPWGEKDLAALAGLQVDAVLVPKVGGGADLCRAATAMAESGLPDATALWAMMEIPQAILRADEIAFAHPRLAGFVLGTNDLARDLGAAQTPDRAPLLTSLSLCLLAARAAGLACIDGVHNAIRDEAGLRAAGNQAREMGFDGKSLIHPAQIAPCNEIFAPSRTALNLARRQLAAFAAARKAGRGIAVVDGTIVENLHAEAARRLVAIDRQIRALTPDQPPTSSA